jgi:AcrR family transcriptional regulator
VIERADVAKATLYSAFGSKDELVRAYLNRRHEARRERIAKKLATIEAPRERILAVFDVLGEVFAQPKFRGCAFLNARAESGPGTAAYSTCEPARAWVRSLFKDLARAAGARHPEHLAQKLVLLYDGATVSAAMDRAPEAAVTAREMAATLIDTEVG